MNITTSDIIHNEPFFENMEDYEFILQALKLLFPIQFVTVYCFNLLIDHSETQNDVGELILSCSEQN